MVEFRRLDAGDFAAPADRVAGKLAGVFLAQEALLFDQTEQLAIADDGGRRVMGEAVETENVHGFRC